MGKLIKSDISKIIRETIERVFTEQEQKPYKYGGLLDPKDFDPINPEVHVNNFGTMDRTTLRGMIATRLKALAKTARLAAAGGDQSYDKFKKLNIDLAEKAELRSLIKAEIEIARQLERVRKKGGRRATPIPKQF